MADIYVDGEQVAQFATRLGAYSRNAGSQLDGIRGDFVRLGESWRDSEYARFAQELDASRQLMQRYLQACDQYEQFLKRKAEAAIRLARQR